MELDAKGDKSGLRNSSGKAWVKGGKIFVKDPAEGGNPPTITPCDGLELYINGNKVEEKTIVCEKDVIEIKTVTSKDPGKYQVRIAPGGLSAVLELKAGTILEQYILDSDPENDLLLKPVVHVQKFCPFNLTEIMQEMAKKNINYGIKHDVIQDILAKPEDGLYVIAAGDPPGNTTDEWVELTFQNKPEGQKVSDDKKINFRDMIEIISVEPGALLAVKHLGVQGNAGRKVTGDLIPPAKPKACELAVGKGAEISSDGCKVLAKIGGSPLVKKQGNRYFFDINPVLHKKGDVDISSGNIRFKGDVVVHGDVCEGMSVQAAGTITILGMVFGANIVAQGDINARRNITGSNLIAGGNNVLLKSFFKILETIHSCFAEIAKLVPDLARHPRLQGVNTGQLIQVLIDKKYTRVPGLLNELFKHAEEHSFILPREIEQLLESIEKNLRGLNLLKLESLDNLLNLLLEIKETQKIIERMVRGKSDISFGYAVNSQIEATGNVKVKGRGCINTTIRAGGNVNISGVFRGGEIIACGDITINEAGSELGAKTLIKTGKGRKISIKSAYEGVRIQIGDRQVNLTSMQSNIIAELDDNGSLAIHAGLKA